MPRRPIRVHAALAGWGVLAVVAVVAGGAAGAMAPWPHWSFNIEEYMKLGSW
jgi:hypothetical protein